MPVYVPKTITIHYHSTYEEQIKDPLKCFICKKDISNTTYAVTKIDGIEFPSHCTCFDLTSILDKAKIDLIHKKEEKTKEEGSIDGLLRKM
jgi:hypothetical protein